MIVNDDRIYTIINKLLGGKAEGRATLTVLELRIMPMLSSSTTASALITTCVCGRWEGGRVGAHSTLCFLRGDLFKSLKGENVFPFTVYRTFRPLKCILKGP